MLDFISKVAFALLDAGMWVFVLIAMLVGVMLTVGLWVAIIEAIGRIA